MKRTRIVVLVLVLLGVAAGAGVVLAPFRSGDERCASAVVEALGSGGCHGPARSRAAGGFVIVLAAAALGVTALRQLRS